jgi:hypothetical protein
MDLRSRKRKQAIFIGGKRFKWHLKQHEIRMKLYHDSETAKQFYYSDAHLIQLKKGEISGLHLI